MFPAKTHISLAWAYAQSDQSLGCPQEESLGPTVPIDCTAKTDQTADAQADLSLCWAHTHFVDFVISWLRLRLLSVLSYYLEHLENHV